MKNEPRRNELSMHQARSTAARTARSPRRSFEAIQARKAQGARQSYEHYLNLARAKALAGDKIEAENCYQHAEHYLRSMGTNAD